MYHGKLNRAHLKHLGTKRCHFQHFFKCNAGKALGLGFNARVGRIDAIDISIDVATVGLHTGRNRNCRGIRATAAQCCNTIIRADALETCNNSYLSHFHPTDDFRTVDFLNTGSTVSIIGLDWNLPTLPRTCINTYGLKRDGQKAARHLLAGRNNRIILACIIKGEVPPATLGMLCTQLTSSFVLPDMAETTTAT